eukprot:scaffold5053_cov138-Skeletonema_dohrnii-CCMP3373.AAC.5
MTAVYHVDDVWISSDLVSWLRGGWFLAFGVDNVLSIVMPTLARGRSVDNLCTSERSKETGKRETNDKRTTKKRPTSQNLDLTKKSRNPTSVKPETRPSRSASVPHLMLPLLEVSVNVTILIDCCFLLMRVVSGEEYIYNNK